MIAEDANAFLRSTIVTHEHQQPAAGGECPTCPIPDDPEDEVLKFEQITIDRVSPTANGCDVLATIRARFRRSKGAQFGGGVTAWIAPDVRERYAGGETPQEQQEFKVHITYRRSPRGGWRAIEFDREHAR